MENGYNYKTDNHENYRPEDPRTEESAGRTVRIFPRLGQTTLAHLAGDLHRRRYHGLGRSVRPGARAAGNRGPRHRQGAETLAYRRRSAGHRTPLASHVSPNPPPMAPRARQ